MRGALRRAVVVLGVVLALAVVAGLVVAGRWWPAPPPEAAPAAEVAVGAGPVRLVCTGPPRLATQDTGLDGEIDVDQEFDPMPAGVVTSVTAVTLGRAGSAAAPATWVAGLGQPADGDPTSGDALTPQGGASSSAVLTGPDGPGLVVAEPADGVAAFAAAAAVARADDGDLRGLAAARCAPTTTSAWLVAGSTELGASSRLVLDNPGDTPATVTLELWGATGPVDPGGSGTVLVPAHAGRAVLLESLAAQESRLAVHLTVEGGAVVPVLQSARLNGFVPAGVDMAEPVADPAQQVLVPGVVLVGSELDDPEPASLRVVNPGEDVASVALRLLGADGPVVVPGAEERVVDPGTVAEISLAGVPAGAYAAELVSDRPVTAAAVLTRVGEASPDDPDQEVVDRAWIGATSGAASVLLTLPGLGSVVDRAEVVLTNPGTTSVALEVQVVLPGGDVREPFEVVLPGEATTVLDGARLSGALAVAVSASAADEEQPDALAGGPAPTAPGVIGAVVLVADGPGGPLVAATGQQPDLEEARSVDVRLPNR